MADTTDSDAAPVFVYRGSALADYGFGDDHPFGPDRHEVFQRALERLSLGDAIHYAAPRRATRAELSLFHTADYLDLVARRSAEGTGFLDAGDTPAFPRMFEIASDVVGTTLAAVDAVIAGEAARAFVPIGGLHHAGRSHAAGFCVFNDCGVAIEYLRSRHGVERIAYVDIDAHHGDGVFYGFESDPALIFADIHEDGRFLYPGTGSACETGKGDAVGSKLNIPLAPAAGDEEFAAVWPRLLTFIDDAKPDFVLMQCGADSLAGDPLTHLRYSGEIHARAARDLAALADRHCGGRIVAMGGGGYNRDNIALAWPNVVRAFVR